MRDFEQRKAEVLKRSAFAINKRKRIIKNSIQICAIVFMCSVIIKLVPSLDKGLILSKPENSPGINMNGPVYGEEGDRVMSDNGSGDIFQSTAVGNQDDPSSPTLPDTVLPPDDIDLEVYENVKIEIFYTSITSSNSSAIIYNYHKAEICYMIDMIIKKNAVTVGSRGGTLIRIIDGDAQNDYYFGNGVIEFCGKFYLLTEMESQYLEFLLEEGNG